MPAEPGLIRASGQMVVLKRRSRLVTFRVSADEYSSLMESCVESGARSIAEYVRAAALSRAHALEVHAGTLHGDLTTLGNALGELDATLILARKRIRDVLGPAADVDQDTIGEGSGNLTTQPAESREDGNTPAYFFRPEPNNSEEK
jgi:hypothetical protein